MLKENRINYGLDLLRSYIEENNYAGYDPYDALMSPLFNIPIFRSNKLIRFGFQQLVKRLPFSIRPLLLVPKGYNPVSLGLAIQAYAYLLHVEPQNKVIFLQKIDELIGELKKLIPPGFSGACWGYDFDWEARNACIPAFQPTVVATGIITNALFLTYKSTGNTNARDLVMSAADFVLRDLNRTYDNETICFSYSPFDEQRVFNASMKAARLLSQAFTIQPNQSYRDIASRAVAYVVNKQRSDGAWGYSDTSSGTWIDNYHTGYVLDCLHEYQMNMDDSQYSANLQRGYSFYIDHFVSESGIPKFYHDRRYPIDCTAAAQLILTSIRFGDTRIACKVAKWMIRNMQKRNGGFYYRKHKYYMIKTSFMRWSDAWMFAALANLKSQPI